MAFRTSLVAHTSVYALSIGAQGLGTLLVLPFVTRVLGPDAYGQVAVAMVVMTLVALITAGGVQGVLVAEYFRDRHGLGARTLASTVAAGSVLLGLAMVAAIALSPATSPRTVLFAVLAAAGLAMVNVEQALFRARKMPGSFMLVTLTATLLAQACGLLAALASPDATAFMAGYAAAVWLAAAGGALRSQFVRPWMHWPEVRGRLRMLGPVLPQTIAVFVLTAGDVALVSIVLGDYETGRYQVAWLLSSMAFYAASALGNAWSPRVLESQARDGEWRYLKESAYVVVSAIAAVSLVVVLAAPVLLPLLAPASFASRDLVTVVALLVPTGPIVLVYFGSLNVLLRARETGRAFLLAGASAALMLATTALLVSTVGIVGAAVGKVIGFSALAASTLVSAQRHSRGLICSWRPARSFGALALGLVGAAVAGQPDAEDPQALVGYGAAGVALVLLLSPVLREALVVTSAARSQASSTSTQSKAEHSH